MKPANTSRFALAALAVVLLAAPSPARELTLVEDGVARAPIVVFEDAPRFTRLAADELAEYIERTTGARPEVIEGRPDPVPDRAIWVGYQPALGEIFPEADFDFQHPEEIFIAANESHLVIVGRDRWDPDNMIRELPRDRIVTGIQQEYGTVNAVYTFLHDYLGVRWLWPGELGQDILKQDTLSFSHFEHRHHPQFRARSGMFWRFNLERHGFRGSGYPPQEWIRFNRIYFDSLETPGGHAFVDWWDRFHETHPEYFALQPDGTRDGWPSPQYAKLCQSNPAVWQEWLRDVERQLEQDPNRRVFNASPNDSWTCGHCVCENCKAWDHPDAPPRQRFHWRGATHQEYAALSDRHVTLANTLARKLKARYPDKDYYVLMMAYGHSRPAPIEAKPDDNVIISSVANFLLRDVVDQVARDETPQRQQFGEWGSVAPNMIWRPNTGSPAGWQQGQPDVPFTRTIEDMRFAAEHNAMGMFIDTVWGHWATKGPMYYLLARLAWNPYADGQAILDDYYQRGFEKAAAEIKAYWELLEATREAYREQGLSYAEAYNEALFETAYGHIHRARQAVEGEPAKYAERIDYVEAGLDFTRRIIEIRGLMARFRESGGEDAEAEATVRANWEEIGEIVERYANTGFSPVTTRPQWLHFRRLHPDYYE